MKEIHQQKISELRKAIDDFPMVQETDVGRLEVSIMKLNNSINRQDNDGIIANAKITQSDISRLLRSVTKQLNQHDFSSDEGSMMGYKDACKNTESALNTIIKDVGDITQQAGEEDELKSRPSQ